MLGDPLDPNTDIGPMVSARQREKVATQVERAVAAGAALVTGGTPSDGPGHFFSPAVVTGAPADTDLLREETFGPVAPIVPVTSLDEAIELANATRYGLGCNVYTRDLKTVVRCMREIKAGTVWFNDPLTDNDAGPFGGMKQSGLGRELGEEGLEAFQETEARPHRDGDRPEGVVVPVRRRRLSGARCMRGCFAKCPSRSRHRSRSSRRAWPTTSR